MPLKNDYDGQGIREVSLYAQFGYCSSSAGASMQPEHSAVWSEQHTHLFGHRCWVQFESHVWVLLEQLQCMQQQQQPWHLCCIFGAAALGVQVLLCTVNAVECSAGKEYVQCCI
jgi:hypothetical protein